MQGEDEKIGPGAPPKAHRFQPGMSGNPSGRPKRQPSSGETLSKVLADTSKVAQNGRTRSISNEERRLRAMVAKAMGGDVRANRAISRILAEGPAGKLAQLQRPAIADPRELIRDLAKISHLDEADLAFIAEDLR